MTTQVGRAVVKIDLDDKGVDKGLDSVKKKAEGLGGVFKTALGTAAGFAGAQLGLQSLGGAFDFLVGTAGNFEQALDGVQAATGATEQEMASMRKEAMRIGKDTSKSASEAVDAMGELVKAGMSVETVLNGGADAAVAMAEATGIDVPQAAVLVSNALNTFQKDGLKSKDVANLFAKAANASAIGVTDLGMSLAAVGPVAASSGLSMEDFVTAMGLMGNNAMRGSDAGTSLKAMLAGLTPVSDKAKDSMKELGFSAFDLNGNFKPMPQIIDELGTALQGMTEEQRATTLELWFGSDGLRAATILLKEGKTGWEKFTGAMAAAPDVAEQARIRMGNFKGVIEGLKGTIEGISITIGTMLLPMLTDLAKAGVVQANHILSWLTEHQGDIESAVRVIAAGIGTIIRVVADLAAMVPPDLAASLGLLKLATMISPAGLVFIAITGLVVLIGVLSSDIDSLATPLLNIRLKFDEFALAILRTAEHLPGFVKNQLGIGEAIDSSIRSLEIEIGDINGTIEARNRATAVLALEKKGREDATAAGTDYVQNLKDQLAAQSPATIAGQKATDQMWLLYDAYIKAGGSAKDLGFSIDGLTGAVSLELGATVDATKGTADFTYEVDQLTGTMVLADTKTNITTAAIRGAEQAEKDAGAAAGTMATDTIGAMTDIERVAMNTNSNMRAEMVATADTAPVIGTATDNQQQPFRELESTAVSSMDGIEGAIRSAAMGIDNFMRAVSTASAEADTAIRYVERRLADVASSSSATASADYGAYAAGGHYESGVPRIVGERGWEIDIPDHGGQVLSHDDSVEALRDALGGGREGISVSMPNATIIATDQQEAERGVGDVAWAIGLKAKGIM